MPEEVKRERSRSGCMADLSESLTAADIAVLKRLNSAGEAWVVGGWVRDALAGITADEVDMATTLRPSEVARLFPRTVMIGEAFGTILVLPRGR
jgi:tRNA nucleotidyltransferase/poly(A) polymerase